MSVLWFSLLPFAVLLSEALFTIHPHERKF